MESKNSRLSRFVNKAPLFYCTISISIVFFLFFSAFAILSTTINTAKTTTPRQERIKCQPIIGTKADTYYTQESVNVFQKIVGNNEMIIMSKSPESEVSSPMNLVARTRRFLGGPGSWPPRCMSKCGRCSPCKPVHVPVPPGTPVTAEYYPEAWRCKCGNRLFMP